MIDLHLHTTASDGALAPPDLVARAASAGLTIISITDHDTITGLAPARDAAARLGIEVISGIEISAVTARRDLHVLGYFFDPSSAPLASFLSVQRQDRLRRVEEMGARLADLGAPIDVAPILAEAGRGKSVGRPQIALALLAAGHVRTRDEAFERFLESGRPACVPRRGASPEEIVGLIHSAGGLASIAHPQVSRRDDLMAPLAEAGLDAIEVRHSDHDRADEQRYRAMAAELGLLVTGGSDFHGDGGTRASRFGEPMIERADFDRLREAAARRRARG